MSTGTLKDYFLGVKQTVKQFGNKYHVQQGYLYAKTYGKPKVKAQPQKWKAKHPPTWSSTFKSSFKCRAVFLEPCPCEFSVSLILQAHKGWAQSYQQSSLLPCSQLLENLNK